MYNTVALTFRRQVYIVILTLLSGCLFLLYLTLTDFSSTSTLVEAAPAESATITISHTVLGHTTTYIGATEAGGFWVEDLDDLGVNTYRLWTKMAELEWWDDDDALDGLWDDSENGVPTIAEIKADASTGFTHTIPWAWWDERFNEVQSWRYGTQTRHDIITALVENGITPIVTLRTYDDQGQPEMRPGAQWAPRPPVTETFRTEWWEHCFAIAYWLNVRHNYGVTHFEVLNEPDYTGQGWQEYGGTAIDYTQLVTSAYEAISYANSFAGLPTYIHAPIVANANSAYIPYILDNADASVHIVDYHTYATDPRASIVTVRNVINSHNPDSVLEPIWVSEWGALWSSYNTFNRAMLTAKQLLTFSEESVEGVTIFNMYDWNTSAGQDYGLIDLQDNGSGGALRVPTETYYAYRLLLRGLAGGKEKLAHTADGFSTGTRTMITRDADNVYVIVLRDNVGATATVHVDLTAIGSGDGAVSVREYSAAHKDAIVATPTMLAAQFDFTVPANGLSVVQVDRTTLAIRLCHLKATGALTWLWIAALGVLSVGGTSLVIFINHHTEKPRFGVQFYGRTSP